MHKKLSLFLFGIFVASLLSFSFAEVADAAVRVRGYYRSNGTYVQSYYRSNSNSTYYDNYSYKGNYNPYTGSYGTKSYSSSYKSYRSYYRY